MSDLVAVVLLLALTAYAVFGGADFGAGFWDLTAGGFNLPAVISLSQQDQSIHNRTLAKDFPTAQLPKTAPRCVAPTLQGTMRKTRSPRRMQWPG